MDSYAAHVRQNTLNFLKENRIIVIGIPVHISYILQSNALDVAVFRPTRLMSPKNFKSLTRKMKVVDVLDVANILHISIQPSHSIKKVRSVFQKSRTWYYDKWAPSVTSLSNVVQQYAKSDGKSLELNEFLSKFEESPDVC